MSAPIKTKEEIVRLSWTTELRRQGHRQCALNWQKGMNVCALGLLAEVAGIPDANERDDVPAIGAVAGLGEDQAYAVVGMNDFPGRTFSEIADIVESWFTP